MRRLAVSVGALLAFSGCTSTPATVSPASSQVAPSLRASDPIDTNARNWPDIHSYADPGRYVTRHYDLDLTADFARHELRGSVTLELDKVDPAARELVLDTRDLAIESVAAAPAGSERFRAARYRLEPADPTLGSALRIELPADARRVRIRYASAAQASGLQWLTPEQTAGKRLPFMYSQAQALHARSFVPLQDTPRIRSTYAAQLRVPPGLVAVMAAEGAATNQRGQAVFRFRMPQPIPSYLLALAVGDLDFRATGPRTGVWAEPSVVAAAAAEFSDAEAMLQKSEALYGAYRWGRYDVLVLPPSFPFGGMENPRLTFLTPTIIAGDKSLVGVLAHEMAHSWSGNLVTNATWRDGWLNEGFTVYFERRIMEAVYGEERAGLEWGVGLNGLRRSLAELAPGEEWRGAIAPDPAQHNGDGSSVAPEKGALFLYQLERHYGRAELDAFLQRWFDRHAFTSVTTPQFVRELQDDLMRRLPGRVDDEFLHRWIDGTGLPQDALFVASDALARVAAQRQRWERGELTTDALETSRWTVQEWLEFLDQAARPQPVARLAELDRRFALTASGNAEIAHAWYRLALASDYPGIEPALERYLVSIGRLKLVRPLYADLMKTPRGAEFARRVYAQARPGYHPITQGALDRIVK
ncbi:MAG TPA: M1 family metallopeptidase [Steroidobacteraceae bacterium]